MVLRIKELNSFSKDLYDSTYMMMASVRRKQIDSIHQIEDKRRSVFGEYLARTMIGEKVGISPEKVIISYSPNGKPLTDQSFFSISHSGKYVACAVDDVPVGIDIENRLRCSVKLESLICTEHERELCSSFNLETKERFLLRLWVLKEACIKCMDGTLLDMPKMGFSFDQQQNLVCEIKNLKCKIHNLAADCILATCVSV